MVTSVPVEAAVPIVDLSDQLSFFRKMAGSIAWTGRVRGSPTRWSESDGETANLAVFEAQAHPIVRPVDPRKRARKPPVVDTKIGQVSVLVYDEPIEATVAIPEIATEVVQEATAHTQIQRRLLRLGSDMDRDVRVACNDWSREYDGQPFVAMPYLRNALRNQFDEATNRTVELIDVL